MFSTVDIISRSEADTLELGAVIGRILEPGDTILMIGELGSGKTRLAKGIISAAVGIPPEEVVSPTFTLMNRFEGNIDVYHADLYRLAPEQVEDVGLEDALDQRGALIVEWAERASFDGDNLVIHIGFLKSPDARRITLEWIENGLWQDRLQLSLSGYPGQGETLKSLPTDRKE